MNGRLVTLVAVLVAALTVVPAVAWANPIDLLGFGARMPAIGNAGVASGDAMSSAFTNPAACAMAPGTVLGIGYGWGSIRLRRNGDDLGLQDAHGVDVGGCIPFPAPFVRIGVSTGFHIPDQWIARIALEPASRPRFFIWDNRPHRVALDVAAALRIGTFLALGGGATFLADGAGNGIDFRVGLRAGQVIAESALDVELPLRAAPVLGLLLTPRDDVRIGLRYSGQISLDLRLDILAQVDVPGTPIGGDTLISVRGIDLYTPEQAAAGVSLGPWRGWTLHTELVWSNWSVLQEASSDVALAVNIGISPSILQLRQPSPGFSDTLSPRLGVEREVALGRATSLALRAGYRFEPTPVPEQTGLSSLMDADRHVVGIGAGLRLEPTCQGRPHPVVRAWTLDASLVWHHLVPGETRKLDPASPGGDFTVDGEVLAAALVTGVEL